MPPYCSPLRQTTPNGNDIALSDAFNSLASLLYETKQLKKSVACLSFRGENTPGRAVMVALDFDMWHIEDRY
jgi:hypothetical protein